MTVLQVNYGVMHPCQLLIMGIMEDHLFFSVSQSSNIGLETSLMWASL